MEINPVSGSVLVGHQQATAALAHSALTNRGYVVASKYDSLCYSIAGVSAYEVIDGFPCILRSSTDVRIKEANYLLSLATLAGYQRDIEEVLTTACANATGGSPGNG